MNCVPLKTVEKLMQHVDLEKSSYRLGVSKVCERFRVSFFSFEFFSFLDLFSVWYADFA